ncbi:MAG: biotin--[acetyl-CoA-carboxylase] ligase [Treponema sp.]|jgi:BirA family biotin operon repressor/biotin-[acetyl-CoA-carboxylase] ligase|nr:biotin--[acetyl-CoA-carboxylase] ligase [Treponema sp.]
MNGFSAEEAGQLDLVNPFGAPVYYKHRLSSTMDAARNLAAEPHGTVICAGFQEAGRGRIRGRRWLGEAGDSLFFTILLRYGSFAAVPAALPLRTGLAVSRAIEDFAPALAGLLLIKWPNDVMIRLPEIPGAGSRPSGRVRKVAGILCESDGSTVFTGVGVNLLQSEFPGELRDTAASLRMALGGQVMDGGARFGLLERILGRLYGEFSGESPWREGLEERLYMKGRPVRFIPGEADSGRLVEGRLVGIGAGGELLILPDGGGVLSFVNGELMPGSNFTFSERAP